MKLSSLFSAIGASAAPMVNTVSALSIILGGIYLVDCRITSASPDERDSCYFTALPLMGVGGAAKGAFALGYNTYNPTLRRSGDSPSRDAKGRFTHPEES